MPVGAKRIPDDVVGAVEVPSVSVPVVGDAPVLGVDLMLDAVSVLDVVSVLDPTPTPIDGKSVIVSPLSVELDTSVAELLVALVSDEAEEISEGNDEDDDNDKDGEDDDPRPNSFVKLEIKLPIPKPESVSVAVELSDTGVLVLVLSGDVCSGGVVIVCQRHEGQAGSH
ncbi:hypothetical protein DL767_003416 [Monosporascus sp. MG133]|nr:hypothetical protein DL767_003416 [Monosporascus sp. MG133]